MHLQPDTVTSSIISNKKLQEEELLSLIVSLSQKMLNAAKEGEWDRVVELEGQRSPQLETLLAKLTIADQTQAISDFLHQAITSIIASDKEVAMLAVAHKDVLSQEVRDLGSSRKAVNAYLDNL